MPKLKYPQIREQMGEEKYEAYRSYQRKAKSGKLAEATQAERDAFNLYINLCAQARGYKDETDRQYRDPVKMRYQSAKKRAKRQGIPFEITLGQWRALAAQATHCPIFGTPLVWDCNRTGKADPNCASPDRIDNNKGYTLENLWFISWRANNLKKDATPQELYLLAKAVLNQNIQNYEPSRTEI